MIGDLRRHGNVAPYQRYTFPNYGTNEYRNIMKPSKTTSQQEGRFNIFKNVLLRGESGNRLHVFSVKLEESTRALQMEALKTYMKGKRKRNNDKATLLIEEQWNKKEKEPEHIRNKKIEKYQQPPFRPIPIVITKTAKPICGKSDTNGGQAKDIHLEKI